MQELIKEIIKEEVIIDKWEMIDLINLKLEEENRNINYYDVSGMIDEIEKNMVDQISNLIISKIKKNN